MEAPKAGAFGPYLDRLREIAFVREAEVNAPEVTPNHRRLDGLLVLKTPAGKHELPVELKRTYLTYATVDGVLAQMKAVAPQPWILFAPYIPRPLGRYLAEHGVNYIDLAGNYRLFLGNRYMAHVEGNTQRRAAEKHRGLRVPGYQVLFTILAEPDLLNAPVRRLADAAGTGKTAAAETVRRLQDENLLGKGGGRRFLMEAKVILERWIVGYATQVRPRLLIGTYRTADHDPADLEKHIEDTLGDKMPWGFGGGAAAARLVRHYRGERTVVHLEVAPADLPKRLQALRADDGPLLLLRMPARVAFNGAKPRTVHPLLIYTELLVTGEPRAREAANEVWDRYLEYLH